MRIAILAHDNFPHHSKTATGVMRYGDYQVEALLDRANVGSTVSEFVPDLPDIPIVEGMDDVGAVDALLVGISPIGGAFDESWRPDVCTALERGCDVISGLHFFLSDDEEFARLEAENEGEIWDVRRPPEGLTVSEGVARDVDAEIVLTVGTDASVGKMTATLELLEAARERGHSAAFIPTGQTGIMIDGWGMPVDRVISDFIAGSVEEMIVERGNDYDYLFVEGQGSINHPAYSGVTCGILHGSMPDRLVLCSEAGQEVIGSYESFSIPPYAEVAELYESLAAPVAETEVVAGALNTVKIEDDEAAREAVESYGAALGLPATDVIRFGTDEILEAIL